MAQLHQCGVGAGVRTVLSARRSRVCDLSTVFPRGSGSRVYHGEVWSQGVEPVLHLSEEYSLDHPCGHRYAYMGTMGIRRGI